MTEGVLEVHQESDSVISIFTDTTIVFEKDFQLLLKDVLKAYPNVERLSFAIIIENFNVNGDTVDKSKGSFRYQLVLDFNNDDLRTNCKSVTKRTKIISDTLYEILKKFLVVH